MQDDTSLTGDFGDVLIVEDDKATQILLNTLMTNEGHATRTCSSGEAALEQINNTLPDLVLLDIKLPAINGLDVCKRLKRSPRTRNIPIIFLSFIDDSETKLSGFSAGGVDYITKPFHKDEVLARVNTHLELYRTRRAVEKLLYENRKLTKLLFSSQEQERRNLSNVLHNEISQQMAAVMFEAQFIQKQSDKTTPDIQASATAILDTTRKMQKMILMLATELHPSVLKDLGLNLSLTELFDNLKTSRPDVTFDLELDDELDAQCDSISIQTYRIVQEFLANATVCSSVDHVAVHLATGQGENGAKTLVITLRDNRSTPALSADNPQDEFIRIRERVIAANGSFNPLSADGHGNFLEIKMPLKNL